MLIYFLIVLFICFLVVSAVLFRGLLVAAIAYFLKLGHNNHGLHIYYSDTGPSTGIETMGLLRGVETMGLIRAVDTMGLLRAV